MLHNQSVPSSRPPIHHLWQVVRLICLTLLLASCAGTATVSPTLAPVVAQPLPPLTPYAYHNLRFDNLSLAQGLSQSVVITSLQDRNGFMWFGTQDGLNRFDGYEFVVYKHDPADPASLSNNFIQALVETDDGALWVGTFGGGLDRLDPLTGQFTHFRHNPTDPTTIGSNMVQSIARAADGTLWLGSNGGGLSQFNPADGRAKVYRANQDLPHTLSSDVVLDVLVDNEGQVWAGTLDSGISRLNPRTGEFTNLRHSDENADSLSNDNIQALFLDSRGQVWVGTATGGLERFDAQTGGFVHYIPVQDDPGSLPDVNVQAVFEDDQGILWVGTASSGLCRLDAASADFTCYRNQPGVPASLSNNNVVSIYQDRGGVYWVGTFGGGVNRFDPRKNKFELIQHQPGHNNTLVDNSIWSVWVDRHAEVWVGTNGGLSRIDRAHGSVQNYVHQDNDPNSLGDNIVWSIVESRSGSLWFGTNAGLSRYRPELDAFENIPGATVFSIVEDRDGTLWYGGANTGVVHMNPADRSTQAYRTIPGNPNSLPDNGVLALYIDRSGELWVGMFTGGLCRFNRSTGVCDAIYQNNPEDPSSLGNNTVLDILEDGQNRFWVGTASGGLNLLDRSSGRFTQFRQKDGLANDTIYGVLEDRAGKLWLSTNNGVSQFDPLTKVVRNYGPQDGLQSNEFNQGAHFRSANGEMFFGGINGLNAFLPDYVQDIPYQPPIVITRFYLYSKPVGVGGNSPLKKVIWKTDTITLNYTDDFFAFEFAALHYSSPEKIQYAYRMEGLEKDWVTVGARHYASYTNVPPGEYTFHVIGANSDGIWNRSGVAIRIIVTPPFWQTWWFRLAASLLVVALVIGVFEARLSIVRAQKHSLEKQVTERTHELSEALVEVERARQAAEAANQAKSLFLANVSHELRTPLNAILGFSQLMLRPSENPRPDEQLPRGCRDNMEIIYRSGEHLLGLINDVLDMSKIEAGRMTLTEQTFNLQRMLDGLEDMFRFRAEGKGLTLDVEIAADTPAGIYADEGKLRQILMNLLGNAVKFTDEGGVVLRVRAEELSERVNRPPGSAPDFSPTHRLTFEVEDSGSGIDADELSVIFEPFMQAAGGQQAQEGTGLGLSISRKFAGMMSGTLTAASEVGKGSIFTLQVPVAAIDPALIQNETPARPVIALEEGQPVYRILVVDDKDVNRLLLVRLLTPLGFEVREAVDGAQALDIWKEWHPHLIFMDMRMPVMNGYEATRRIKATTLGQATVVVALTASALEEDRAVILSEGCDDYIRKPFRESEIFDTLTRHLGVRFRTLAEENVTARLPVSRRHIDLAGRLAALDGETRDLLREAAILGHNDRLLACVERIRAQDEALADALEEWVNGYQLHKILRLFERGEEQA